MNKDTSRDRSKERASQGNGGFWSRLCRGGILRRFARNRRGNVAISFALAAVPLLVSAGVAVDLSRALIVRQRLANALDAAGLAVGRTLGLDQQGMETLATNFFQANYPIDALGTPGPVSVSLSGNDITLSVSADLNTAIMKIVGVNTLTVNATAKITRAAKGLELALVLDTTGSMAWDSPSRISSLKTASTDLLDILFGDSQLPDLLKVAVVPFAAAVRLDPATAVQNGWIDRLGRAPWAHTNFTGDDQYGKTYSQDSNGSYAWCIYSAGAGYDNTSDCPQGPLLVNTPWTGCVEARANREDETDDGPTSDALKWVPMFAPDEPHVGEPENASSGSKAWNMAAPNQSGISSNYSNDYIGLFLKVSSTTLNFNSVPSFNALEYTSVSKNKDTLTISSHGLSTGYGPIRVYSSNLPSPLSSSTDYWVIKNNNNTIELATSYADAMSNNAVNLTNTGSSSGVINVFDSGSNHHLSTGDGPIRVRGSLAGGLSSGTDYWITNATSDHFELAASQADASAGKGVSITSVGGTSYTNALYSSNHGLATGDGPVQLTGSLPGGLSSGTDYWIRKVNSDVFQFATSKSNATANPPTIVAYTYSGSGTLTTPGVDIVNDTLNAPNHGMSTGEGPVRVVSTGSLPGGVSATTDYWIIRVDANTVKLATSRSNALAGTPVVDLTALGSGTIYTAESPGGTSLSEQAARQQNYLKYAGRSYSGENGPYEGCGMQPVTMLTNDRQTLDNAIAALNPSGNTHIPLGLSWGWRLISSNLPGSGAVPYSNEQYIKAIVLMTDGDNTMGSENSTLNGTVYDAYGYGNQERMGSGINTANEMASEIDSSLTRTCSAIKAIKDSDGNDRIRLYTIAFGSSISSTAQSLLCSCAGDADEDAQAGTSCPKKKYFYAPDGDELKAAFQTIATDLSNLRISH